MDCCAQPIYDHRVRHHNHQPNNGYSTAFAHVLHVVVVFLRLIGHCCHPVLKAAGDAGRGLPGPAWSMTDEYQWDTLYFYSFDVVGPVGPVGPIRSRRQAEASGRTDSATYSISTAQHSTARAGAGAQQARGGVRRFVPLWQRELIDNTTRGPKGCICTTYICSGTCRDLPRLHQKK